MAQVEVITYGEGGADDSKPDGNVVDRQWVEAPDPEPVDPKLAAAIATVQAQVDPDTANPTAAKLADALATIVATVVLPDATG